MIGFYIVLALGWLAIFGLLTHLASTSHYDTSRKDAQKFARIALGAPIWPALLVFFLARGILRLIRLAVKGTAA